MADDRNKRYIDGYDSVYKDVREGLKRGEKNGHWMWFIFPQVKGLGKSPVSDFYAFDGIGDAKAFYANWGLRRRLVSLFRIVNSFPDKAYLTKCFGEIDSKKFYKEPVKIFCARAYDDLLRIDAHSAKRRKVVGDGFS